MFIQREGSMAMAPETKRRTATKGAASGKSPVARTPATPVDRTAELSEEVLQSVEDGQRAAIDAVRRFVDTVDRTLPALPHGEGPSKRQEIVDSALAMADRLVHTQYEFIRKVVDDAGRSLRGPGGAK
jgi:hypothetical protein